VLDNLCLLCRYHHTLTHTQQAQDSEHRESPVPVGHPPPT
jgi:hypothetical protein